MLRRLPTVSRSLSWIAVLWIVFGAVGLVDSGLGLLDAAGPTMAWRVFALGVSVALITAGLGILRGRIWARWLAAAAVAAALTETTLLLTSNAPGAPNPVLFMTAAVHLAGLGLLVAAGARHG